MTERPVAPLALVAYEELKQRIARCELAPGRWITERQVAEDLGLGLTPVRTALARLSNENLVQTVPRRGYRVTPLTIKSVDDLFRTWLLIAPEIMRLVACNLTPELLADYTSAVREALTGMPDAAPRLERTLRVSQVQWQFFARACGNAYLTETYLRLEGDLRRVFTLAYGTDTDPTGLASAERERALAFPFEDGDPDRAAEFARQFIAGAHHRVLETLRRTPAATAAKLGGQPAAG